MPKFTEINIAFRVFENDTLFYGVADVELPEVSQINETIEGAGMAGKYNSPVVGNLEPMSLKINFRNITEDTYKLHTPDEHEIVLRASIQVRDTESRTIKSQSVKHVIKCVPLKFNPGKLTNYSTGDCSGEFSVNYFATFVDGVRKMEVDIFNYIYEIDGKDYLADIRKDLGL